MSSPTPISAATPSATATAHSAPTPIETVIVPPPRRAAPLWPWWLGAGGAGLVALAWIALRRGRPEGDEALVAPVGSPPEVARPAAARLALTLRPTRAGLNLISATVECEVAVINTGLDAAADIRVAVRLQSAHAGQDPELAAFFAEPLTRPDTPPFSLGPGEERRFRAVAAVPRDAIRPLQAGGRAMFVPLVALSAHYRDGERDRRVGQAFAIGVERVDSAKLAPFWLDVPARSYEGVAARPHGGPVEG